MFETDLFDSGRSIFSLKRMNRRVLGVGLMISGILFSLLSLGLFIWQVNFKFNQVVPSSEMLVPLASDSAQIWVDVGGAVKQPGLYQFTQGDRLAQAVASAGGFSRSADKHYLNQQLNLAQLLSDGQKIYIPTKLDLASHREESAHNGVGKQVVAGTNNLVSSQTQLGLSDGFSATKISINSASQTELEKLNGIGEGRALKIIQNRPYNKLEELLIKKVLSEKIFQQNLAKLAL